MAKKTLSDSEQNRTEQNRTEQNRTYYLIPGTLLQLTNTRAKAGELELERI